ncbi:endonuclease/exonuclease/phosphatase family protein [Poronia punctata]|nr:endonuclease/exonuclease/phosphatase family protein [Poronia punctata]
MDQILQNAIKRAEEQRKPLDLVPWTVDEAYPQAIYEFDAKSSSWKESTTITTTTTSPTTTTTTTTKVGIDRIALFSWNIDFMLPFPTSRMKSALGHLHDHHISSLLPSSSSTAVVVFFQEWVFRVHFDKTGMERDGLFVDVIVPVQGKEKGKVVRLVNAHLESLAIDPPFRPAQMELIARFMKDGNGNGDGDGDVEGAAAVVAGDFNAIQPFDRTLHVENGLRDAFLDLGGKEDCEEGYTWGQQAATDLRNRFGCSRMDKVFYCGDGVDVERFERFGEGVEVEDEREKEEIRNLGFEKGWITDHLGVFAEIVLRKGEEEEEAKS